MANPNLSKLSIEALLVMRGRVDQALLGRRAELHNQLERLGSGRPPGRKRRGTLKGKKVAPKYRDNAGNTWAGRGARPRWLVEAMKKSGKKLDAYLIDKSARKGRKKRKTKRRSR